MKNTRPFMFYIDPDLFARMQELSRKIDLNLSQITRQALLHYLQEFETAAYMPSYITFDGAEHDASRE